MADPDDRLLGGLTIQVLRVHNLHKVVKVGIQDPYVQIGLNQEKKVTRVINDGGSTCEFNETLRFNLDCQKQDLLHIKVKHKTTFSNTTIGIFSLKMIDFIKHKKKKMQFQLVDEETFEDRGTIELINEYNGTNEPPQVISPYQSVSPPATPVPSVGQLASSTPPPYAASPLQPARAVVPSPIVSTHPVLIQAPPVVGGGSGGYQPPALVAAPPVVGAGGMYAPPPPVMQPYGSQPMHPSPQPYGSQPPQQPYASHPPPPPQPFGSLGPPPPHLPQHAPGQFGGPPVAPFQTLCVGRPHQDSRMFDDVAYLTSVGASASGSHIMEVRLFAGHRVTGIQLVYNINGARLDGPIAGAALEAPTTLHLAAGERLETILGRVSATGLESLTLVTSRTQQRYGASNDGQDFQLNIPQGHRVIGFHGSFAPSGITSVGAYTTHLL